MAGESQVVDSVSSTLAKTNLGKTLQHWGRGGGGGVGGGVVLVQR